MVTDAAFMEYVAEQLSEAGVVTYRKMFGEYGLYLDGKFFATVENNRLCLKMTEAGGRLLGNPEIISPHEGAFYFWVKSLDDRVFGRAGACDLCGVVGQKTAEEISLCASSR